MGMMVYNVNAVVERPLVNVSVEDTEGLLTRFCIVNAVNLFVSITGDILSVDTPLIRLITLIYYWW